MRFSTLLAALGFAAIVSGCMQRDIASQIPLEVGSGASGAFHDAPQPGGFRTLYRFHGYDGARPLAPVTVMKGLLYGTTAGGGASDRGTVYEINSNAFERTIYSFGDDVGAPMARLLAVNDVLYGTTGAAGIGASRSFGTVFALTASGARRVVHTFNGPNGDGSDPESGLTLLRGALFGTTVRGGMQDRGTVYEVDPFTGEERVVHSFGSGTDGAHPYAGLALFGSKFYGTTSSGGAGRNGTLFEVSVTGAERVLHSFGHEPDGAQPYASLVLAGGVLYGTTLKGGANGAGTVFTFAPATGVYSVLHSFGSSGDGAAPIADLVANNGVLYGTTLIGGANHKGTVFVVGRGGSESVLHSFTGGTGGAHPHAGLTLLNGMLYGTTAETPTIDSGPIGNGTIFEMNPLPDLYQSGRVLDRAFGPSSP